MRERTSTRCLTRYRIVGPTLVVDLGGTRRVLSSAPKGGGIGWARFVLNHQVISRPDSGNSEGPNDPIHPARYLIHLAEALGIRGKSIGLMTAVPMKQLVTARACSGSMWVECFATVGTTNAVRAGEWPEIVDKNKKHSLVAAGTINLILVTNACLTDAALVGAVQVATESKTGVLRDHDVESWTGMSGATGTGTDATVIACRRHGQRPKHQYSGTHTVIGAMIGSVVSRCMKLGLARERRWNRSARLKR